MAGWPCRSIHGPPAMSLDSSNSLTVAISDNQTNTLPDEFQSILGEVNSEVFTPQTKKSI